MEEHHFQNRNQNLDANPDPNPDPDPNPGPNPDPNPYPNLDPNPNSNWGANSIRFLFYVLSFDPLISDRGEGKSPLSTPSNEGSVQDDAEHSSTHQDEDMEGSWQVHQVYNKTEPCFLSLNTKQLFENLLKCSKMKIIQKYKFSKMTPSYLWGQWEFFYTPI